MLEIDIASMLMCISVAKKRAVWLKDPTKSAHWVFLGESPQNRLLSHSTPLITIKRFQRD